MCRKHWAATFSSSFDHSQPPSASSQGMLIILRTFLNVSRQVFWSRPRFLFPPGVIKYNAIFGFWSLSIPKIWPTGHIQCSFTGLEKCYKSDLCKWHFRSTILAAMAWGFLPLSPRYCCLGLILLFTFTNYPAFIYIILGFPNMGEAVT